MGITPFLGVESKKIVNFGNYLKIFVIFEKLQLENYLTHKNETLPKLLEILRTLIITFEQY